MFRTALVLGILLALAGHSRAGDACLQASLGFGCFPCDLPIDVGWIGYSTDGPPCKSPSPGIPAAADEAGSDSRRGWWTALVTLSASDTDPFVNQGPLASADKALYLWLADAGCGYGFNSTSIVFEGDLPLNSYEPVAPGTHDWYPSAEPGHGILDLSLPCVGDVGSPALVGRFLASTRISEPVGPEFLGLERTSWGSVKSRWLRPGRPPAR